MITRRCFMPRLPVIVVFILICGIIITGTNVQAEQKGKPVFGRIDTTSFKYYKNVHDGAGGQYFQEMLGSKIFESNQYFVHYCIIEPKSGIGEHLHRNSEEMYFAFDRPAEFTVNGRTALLPAGSCVLCPLNSSHGIYNNSDKPLKFLNISVLSVENKGGVDYGEDLTNQKIESPAPFKWANFDRTIMKPITKCHQGKGELLFHRLWSSDSFKTNILFLDHLILPPDTSIGYHQHNTMEEIYYILNGKGRITVNNHTWDVMKGDAIPCTLHDSHGIYNNTDEELEIFVWAVSMEKGQGDAKDMEDDLADR